MSIYVPATAARTCFQIHFLYDWVVVAVLALLPQKPRASNLIIPVHCQHANNEMTSLLFGK